MHPRTKNAIGVDLQGPWIRVSPEKDHWSAGTPWILVSTISAVEARRLFYVCFITFMMLMLVFHE
jgi:hypothetical protein